MFGTNVEVARSLVPSSGIDFVEILEVGVPEEFWAAFEPDFEVEFISGSRDVESFTYRGAAGIEAGWRDWLEPWESYRAEVEEFIDAGDDVIVTARGVARARRGGGRLGDPGPIAVTGKDGKGVRVR